MTTGLVAAWSGFGVGFVLLGLGGWLERRQARSKQDQSIENL